MAMHIVLNLLIIPFIGHYGRLWSANKRKPRCAALFYNPGKNLKKITVVSYFMARLLCQPFFLTL